MELNSYLKSCSKLILKKICKISQDKRILEIYQNYNQNLGITENVDYTWSLISTALLLSENLWKNDSLYKSITYKMLDTVGILLDSGKTTLRGDLTISNNCLLDSNNAAVNPFYVKDLEEFVLEEIRMNPDGKLDEVDFAHKEFLKSILRDDKFGCNEAIVTDDEIDLKKLIIRVRHALAHSNYEILNDDFIRLYHYNRSNKKLDFNVALKKEVIVAILDELNELFNDLGEKFLGEWNKRRSGYLRSENTKIDEAKLFEYLLSFNILGEENVLSVIAEAKKDPDFENSFIADKLDILSEIIVERLTPVCSFGIMVNEFLYGNDNGLMDDEYYTKVGYYKYFNSELFKVHMDSLNSEYNKNKLEMLLFAFLNTSLLNSVNLANNEFLTPIDFRKMVIDEDFMEDAQSYSNKYTVLLNNKIANVNKNIEKIDGAISSKHKVLQEHFMLDNEYFKNRFPNEITKLIKQKSHYIIELNELYQMLQVSEYIGLTNYILNHLRNSLAHGYIKILDELNVNNICETRLEFSDYDPEDKTKITFKGVMKLGDLLEILTDQRYLKNVVGINIEESIIKVK